MRGVGVLAGLLAAAGAAEAALRTVNVRSVAPGVPAWVLALAVVFGALVGGGFVLGRAAARSRAASGYGDPAARPLGAEAGAFVVDEDAYKGALLRKLGGRAGAGAEPRPRARHAPCPHCAAPVRFAPGETNATCVQCGRAATYRDD